MADSFFGFNTSLTVSVEMLRLHISRDSTILPHVTVKYSIILLRWTQSTKLHTQQCSNCVVLSHIVDLSNAYTAKFSTLSISC